MLGLQGLVGLISNPVLANGVAGLATSATAQATVQVGHIIWIIQLQSTATCVHGILFVQHLHLQTIVACVM